METKVYVIFAESCDIAEVNWNDKKWFIDKAEELGTVYSLIGFQDAINNNELYIGDETSILITESEA